MEDKQVSLKQVLDEIARWVGYLDEDMIYRIQTGLKRLPSAQPERKRMSNKEWINFLSEQFDVSRTSAREMLHAMMSVKKEDNFKKQFRG